MTNPKIPPQREELTFDSNYEPAKPSQVIMQMLAEKLCSKQLAVMDPDVGFMANNDVFDDLDAYIGRLLFQTQKDTITRVLELDCMQMEHRNQPAIHSRDTRIMGANDLRTQLTKELENL